MLCIHYVAGKIQRLTKPPLALAAVSFLRALAGFGFPLFAPAMYKALGYGKGDTILAALAIALGCPSPWLFWHFGERIRKRSHYSGASHRLAEQQHAVAQKEREAAGEEKKPTGEQAV